MKTIVQDTVNVKTLNIPFFYGAQDNKDNGGIPAMLPFRYYYDAPLKLYRQFNSEELRQILKEIYLKGSMLNGEMNAVDGGHQGKAALDFISEQIKDLAGKRILEIGCGNGFILKELSKKGAICTGLEPGPQIEEAAHADGKLELINDFFPSSKLTGTFDAILHFNVLEHLEEPVESLKAQAALLAPNGQLIFGMPNCEPNLKTGDLSIFAHEHYNYFTRDSFLSIAGHCGLEVKFITTGASNGMIFCSFVKAGSQPEANYTDSMFDWTSFEDKINNTLNNLKKKIGEYAIQDVAVYCPKRALNALSILGISDCRLIDDTVEMYGKYLPTLSQPIGNIQTLVEQPPKAIIIFSRTFGKVILEKCRSYPELGSTEIFLLEQFD